MRFSEMPENSHRQRLATPRIASALRRLFLSVSRAKDCAVERRPYRQLQRVKKFAKLRRCKAGAERAFVFSAQPDLDCKSSPLGVEDETAILTRPAPREKLASTALAQVVAQPVRPPEKYRQ